MIRTSASTGFKTIHRWSLIIIGSFMQKMTNCETKSVAAIDWESLFQGGL